MEKKGSSMVRTFENNKRNSIYLLWVFGIVLASLLAVDAVNAASLWQNTQNSIFADLTARNVGDLVTIIIVESTKASQSTQTTTGKDSSVELGPGVGVLDFIPLAKASTRDGWQNSGKNVQGGSISAKMTSRVIEVLPNGNLVIEGSQSITVNREDQEIIVRGVIRPADIEPNNTILSTFVSDASISYQGSGSLGSNQKPGILTQILNWIF